MSERQELANAIRMLAVDAVEKANSGHPGMPMGMADIAEVLWNDFMKHNPADPNWINRDRFVLSNGHGSMLLYAVLHLSGYALTIEDLKDFRQLYSKTPGHPEFGHAPGVETTTGPLGQGIANAVGMALAEKILAAQFNEDALNIIDHFTYCFVGDGCLMEGISHEACSLAGTFKLGKLITFYDDNGISIDGPVSGWFTDDTAARFRAYGWHVIEYVDGHDPQSISSAIQEAQAEKNNPTLIMCKTIIGFGSPNLAGSEKTHGSALGEKEIQATRDNLNWKYSPFEIPESIYDRWNACARGKKFQEQWNKTLEQYQLAYPDRAVELIRRMRGDLPLNWDQLVTDVTSTLSSDTKPVATRKASLIALNQFAGELPELIGGSADLTGSNCTLSQFSQLVNSQNFSGNYIEYGVREFGMVAIMNGLSLHGGFIAYGGTFLTFLDYARNAVRLSALMKQRVIYVFTHDSIGLGEDGPTHQPVEHANMLRMTPNMSTWRPCDVMETWVAWQLAIERRTGPTSLLLTRQDCLQQSRTPEQIAGIRLGGYVLCGTDGDPDVIVIATGSEVDLAVEAHHAAKRMGIHLRVVSMPCTNIFEEQSQEYQESVLPSHIQKRIAIEAGSTAYWYKYVGLNGIVIGMDCFGESAPAEKIYEALNITTQAILDAAKTLISK